MITSMSVVMVCCPRVCSSSCTLRTRSCITSSSCCGVNVGVPQKPYSAPVSPGTCCGGCSGCESSCCCCCCCCCCCGCCTVVEYSSTM
uniref:Putative secreted protein n=1 Tax=Anopheles marajoara TaxID=58244 RepID=A0A2M4C4T9_9DIPT